MQNDIEYVLLEKSKIDLRVSEIGKSISEDFAGKNPLFIGVLKGSFIFMADLIRNVTIPCSMEFMAVSSYGSKSLTTGAVKIYLDLNVDVENRHLIIVEDILDSGLTLNYLVNYLSNRNPASITLTTLLDKPSRRQVPIHVNYTGFEIPDAFVVGYGLDYAERYRNLPYIGVLKPEVYSD